MREIYEKDYDDFTLADYSNQEISGSLSPFTFLCVTAVIILFGLIMCYSASYDEAARMGRLHYHFLLALVFHGAIALVCAFILFFVPRKSLERIFYFALPLSLILFALNILEAFGVNLSGFPSLSGSDALVFSSVLALAYVLPRVRENALRGYVYLLIFILSLVITYFMMLTLGLSYALLFFSTLLITFCMAQTDKKFIMFYSLFSIVLILFMRVAPEEIIRSLFSPFYPERISVADPANTARSVSAIAEGGIFGKGIGASSFKLGLIDGIEDEYIFASIAEEIGLLGVMMILIFFFLFLFLGLRCAERAWKMDDDYIGIVTIAFTFLIVCKAILSMIITSGIIPSRGISMPFFSADGFSYFITLIECAFLYRFMHITGRGYEKIYS